MIDSQHISVLMNKHQELEDAIVEECSRPLPDGLVVQMLKRRRLRIKDEISSLSQETSRQAFD